MSDQGGGAQWIEDGHVVHFRLDRDVVNVSHIECPYDGKIGVCNRNRAKCVVETYIEVYGTEICVGVALIEGPIEIAWVPNFGSSDLDDEFEQVWFTPVRDPDYIAYKLLGAQSEP